MNLSEFELISRIRQRTRTGRRVLMGIGDDAAVLRAGKGMDILITTDMLIEDRHFRRRDASAYEIGRKAMAVNLSDIAAMGGVPTAAVAAVGLPKNLSNQFIDDLFLGMRRLAARFKVDLVGGDTNRSDKLVISVTMVGEVERGRAVTRSGARVGDALAVSGALGGSYASKKHLRFVPRISEARDLTKRFHIHAMMDLSDGLASDAKRMAEESGVGVLIEEALIPVSRAARHAKQALTDGEDFELFFALPMSEAARLPKKFRRVGRVTAHAQGSKLLKKDGTIVPLTGGFDHLR